MVSYLLKITAEPENLTDLQPQGGCDDSNFTYCIKLKCRNCGELSEKLERNRSRSEKQRHRQSRSEVKVLSKGWNCLNDQWPRSGFEPVDFAFGSGWKVESVDGTKFDAVDLSGGDFAEYDEKGECPVMISNLRLRLEVVK
ncbi:CXXC motif containing zinc binding protein, eukaryotic [Dillenia turbinata]|uniref:CXXC motif containing zinc binding protein, eukaryotic n=1 Tax=Dillenia turbinata TaxID=194707 RepID=A0AAN8V968_9MAGN